MEQSKSPLRSDRQPTLQQFDFYVERARAERSKAIAELGTGFAAWLAGLAHRMAGHGGRARPGDGART